MTTTQIIIVCTTILAALAMLLGRNLTVTFRDVKATVEKTNEAIGAPNGQGDAMSQLAKLDSKVEAVNELLDQRTHVTRAGSDTPEEIGPYSQTWFHEINTHVTVLGGQVYLMWQAMRDYGFDLPDMRSMQDPTEEP